jgi:hypothetical protein
MEDEKEVAPKRVVMFPRPKPQRPLTAPLSSSKVVLLVNWKQIIIVYILMSYMGTEEYENSMDWGFNLKNRQLDSEA